MDCIFCKLAKGEIPAAKVAETDDVLAFLDISPANKGHIIIIPKQHAERVDEIDEKTFGEMAILASRLAKRLMQVVKPDGYNILVNNAEAAGQEVMHLHLHVMPRFDSDDFAFRWTHKKYGNGEMQELAEKLRL